MARSEFLSWLAFYELQPFDDFHRFHRPAAMISTALGGGSVAERLVWLQPPPPPAGDYSEADLSFFKAFGIKPPTKG